MVSNLDPSLNKSSLKVYSLILIYLSEKSVKTVFDGYLPSELFNLTLFSIPLAKVPPSPNMI